MKYRYCCSNCFNVFRYPQILEEIHRHNLVEDECPVCGKKSQQLVETSDLADFLAPVFSKYEEAAYGENYHTELGTEASDVGDDLSTCIEEDFQIFNPDIFDKTNDLIDSIRDIDSDPKEYSVSASSLWCRKKQNFTHISEKEYWDIFCDYIKHDRRFILNWDHLPFLPDELFSKTLLCIKKGTMLYRARKHDSVVNTPFNPDYKEMGAPDPNYIEINEGRANPAGISYLYLADSIETALKEIRAQQGDFVTIAEFEILEKTDAGNPRLLEISDLTMSSVRYVDVFSPNEERENKLADMIIALNENMSQPVSKKIDYIPTQFLSEAIRDLGFDGLRFNSSLEKNGLNYVFFMTDDNDKFSIKITKTYLVKVEDLNLAYDIVRKSEKFPPEPLISIPSYKRINDSVLRRTFNQP